jgi:hypothetical protein
MTNIDVIFDQLKGKLKAVRDRGSKFTSLCPAHDDSNPSLSGCHSNDRILLKCHAGCSFDDICSALGISAQDLYCDRVDTHTQEIICYDYVDESGDRQYQILRQVGKKFVVRREEAGEWVYGLGQTRRILYKLDVLEGAKVGKTEPEVFLVEGEKDVDRLLEAGLTATTNPFGAGKWRDDYCDHLTGCICYVIPDNDEPGRQHAEVVARSLEGKATTVRIVPLPELPEKGDVSDWFSAGHTADDLLALARMDPSKGGAQAIESGLQLVSITELMAEPDIETDYLVDQLLPSFGMSVVSGKPKAGKSTLIRNLLRSVARGEPFLGRQTASGPVIYLSLEEIRDQIRKQLRKMGVTVGPVHICTTINNPDTLLRDLTIAIDKYEPKLVIIDPMVRVVRVNDYNDYARMAQAMEPFIELARAYGIHLCLPHHNNKHSGPGGEAVLGSTAIFGGVDTLIQIYKKDGQRYVRSENRYGADLPDTIINFDKETLLVSLGATLTEKTEVDLTTLIMEYIGPGGKSTQAELRKATGANGEKISKALKDLIASGRLVRSGAGKSGDPYRYEQLDSDFPLIDLIDGADF